MSTWQEFYQKIRDASWPDCVNEHEFNNLPDDIQKEILHEHAGLSFVKLTKDEIVDVFQNNTTATAPDQVELEFRVANDFVVYYNKLLDGGGTTIGQRYSLILKYLYPNRKFDRCLDWCGGSGLIGFRLLADGICDKVDFVESFVPAVDACKKTLTHMPDRFANRVQMHTVDSLTLLPTDAVFDLVVSNPPHYPLQLGQKFFDIPQNHHDRITVDRQWQAHRDFFANIKRHLSRDGVILLQEIYHVDEYAEAIRQGGLKIKRMFAEKRTPLPWYLELEHQ